MNNFQVGQLIRIDTLDFLGEVFTIDKVRHMERQGLKSNVPWTDCYCENDKQEFRLRFADFDKNLGVHLVLLLRLHDSFPYTQDFEEVLKDQILRFDDEQKEFTRIREVTEPFFAYENKKTSIVGWDYWREDQSGKTEFCYVEQDTNSRMFEIWTGFELNPMAITIL